MEPPSTPGQVGDVGGNEERMTGRGVSPSPPTGGSNDTVEAVPGTTEEEDPAVTITETNIEDEPVVIPDEEAEEASKTPIVQSEPRSADEEDFNTVSDTGDATMVTSATTPSSSLEPAEEEEKKSDDGDGHRPKQINIDAEGKDPQPPLLQQNGQHVGESSCAEKSVAASTAAITADSMAVSMGMHSMDQPPTTPVMPSASGLNGNPPLLSLEQESTRITQANTESSSTAIISSSTTPVPSKPATAAAAETTPQIESSTQTDKPNRSTTAIPILEFNDNDNTINNSNNNSNSEDRNTISLVRHSNGNEENSLLITTTTTNTSSTTSSSTLTTTTSHPNNNNHQTAQAAAPARANKAATPAKTKSGASKTLAALFGGPSIGSAPEGYNYNSAQHPHHLNHLAAAQRDYTLVGDSPYETTYDPQSPYYYNRVYGQLYITTISVMFRGKAFGPIGAIPYERRLLLPFLEVATVEPYKTTSVKIAMHDGETYIFKSFADREGMVRLLRRTQKKCCEKHRQQQHHQPQGPGRIATSILSNGNTNKGSSTNTIHDTKGLESIRVIQSDTSSDRSLQEETVRDDRRSRAPTSQNGNSNSHRKNSNSMDINQEVHRRSKSMPSSLRAKAAMGRSASSVTTTPQKTPVFFPNEAKTSQRKNTKARANGISSDDERLHSNNINNNNNKTPKTNEKRQSSQRMPANSLRLSLHTEDEEEAQNGVGHAGSNNSSSNTASTRPRRLFELEPSSMAPNATAASTSALMMSPPRTTISQRKQPKTPQVAGVGVHGNGNSTPTHHHTSSSTSQQVLHRRREPAGGKSAAAGTLASIPPIPTVPSLNTPEPRSQQTVITIEDGRLARSNAVPLAIPEIDNDDVSPPLGIDDRTNATSGGVHPRILAPMTPVANVTHSHQLQQPQPLLLPPQPHRDPAEDAKMQKAWQAARATDPKTQKDWTVALEPTQLQNCTLDDWFDLFFSDDAVFSLARYQLEHVGDRDVSFHPWRRTSTKSERTDHDGIPELEREISYIHPIGGKSMIGPSEAETFRTQTLKRYGNHGAILKNVTTVGKGIPMGDCFRVEDKWIIEKDSREDSDDSITLSVSFRVVFVKRTMFKGMIQKNTLSETKEWFQGYSQMMLQTALESPQHQELRKQRRHGLSSCSVVPEEMSTPSSSAPSLGTTRETSLRTEASLLHKATAGDSPSTGSMSEGQFSRGSARRDESHRWGDSLGGTPFWMGVVLVGACVMGLLLAVVALWLQVKSVGTSLSLVEGRLGELQAQNTMLLRKLEELSVAAKTTTTTTMEAAGATPALDATTATETVTRTTETETETATT